MASEILGLFGGQTPQQLRNAFLDSTMVSPQQMAQQGLLQQVVSMGQNAGSMIGAGAGQLFGGKVAGEVEASYLEDSLAQVEKMDFKNDAEKMAALGDLLAQKPGMSRQAMLARQEANKLKLQGYEMGAMERDENYRKDLAALGANPTTAQLALLDKKYGNVEAVRADAKNRATLEAETKEAQSRAATLTKYLPKTIPKEVITSLSSKASQPIYQAVMKDVVNPQNEFKEVNGEIGLYNKRDGSLVHNLGKVTPAVAKPPTIVQLQNARDALATNNPNDPRIAEIQKQIDKLGTPSKGTEVTLQLPGAEKPIDIPKFRNDIKASVKTYTDVIDIADTVILGIDLGLKDGNFTAVEGASKALVKAFGDGQISRLEAINAGADPSLIGGGIDYVNKLFTGTPSDDTMKKVKQTAEALKILNAKKQKAELKSQKDIARRSGYTEADIKLLFSSFEDSKQRKVFNTGVEKSTGRKVIKYDDGSVEYAN